MGVFCMELPEPCYKTPWHLGRWSWENNPEQPQVSPKWLKWLDRSW